MDGVEISIARMHGRYMRPLARAFVIAALWTVCTASGAPAQEVPALPRVTTISGSHSGYTDVELTKPLRAFDEDEPEITFNGGGQVIGVVLRSLPDTMGNSEFMFDTYAVGGVGRFSGISSENNRTLPPGRYRLYLIAEQPGSATIEFPKLEPGQLSVEPVVETPQRSGPMSTRSSGDIVKFSERVTLWGGGVIFMKAFPTPGIGTELELCNYWPNQEEQAGERAYDRGCPSGYSAYKEPIMSEGKGAFSFSTPSSHWVQGKGGNVTDLIGTPGPVRTYLFTAGYELAAPPAWTGEPDPVPAPDEAPTVWGPSTANPPPSGEPTPEPEPEPEPEPSGQTGERQCGDSGCAPQWGTALLASRRALLRGRRARVIVSCSGGEACRGSVGFARTRARRFELDAGAHNDIRITVPRKLRRLVLQSGRARGRVVVASRLSDERVQVRQRIRIRPDA